MCRPPIAVSPLIAPGLGATRRHERRHAFGRSTCVDVLRAARGGTLPPVFARGAVSLQGRVRLTTWNVAPFRDTECRSSTVTFQFPFHSHQSLSESAGSSRRATRSRPKRDRPVSHCQPRSVCTTTCTACESPRVLQLLEVSAELVGLLLQPLPPQVLLLSQLPRQVSPHLANLERAMDL